MKFRLALCSLFFVSGLCVAQPPYSGTVFVDPDILQASDPSTFVVAVPSGTGSRQMFDRRVNNWVQRNAYIVDTAFSDGLTIEVQVNPEFGSSDEARAQAVRWAEEVGRLALGFLTRRH